AEEFLARRPLFHGGRGPFARVRHDPQIDWTYDIFIASFARRHDTGPVKWFIRAALAYEIVRKSSAWSARRAGGIRRCWVGFRSAEKSESCLSSCSTSLLTIPAWPPSRRIRKRDSITCIDGAHDCV